MKPKMKNLIVLLILVQVGSDIWVQPESVSAVHYRFATGATVITLVGGRELISYWKPEKVLEALK